MIDELKKHFDSPTPDYSGSDLVTLQPYMDYIEDPSLLKALMQQQGI